MMSCIEQDCKASQLAKWLCNKHYRRHWRKLNPERNRETNVASCARRRKTEAYQAYMKKYRAQYMASESGRKKHREAGKAYLETEMGKLVRKEVLSRYYRRRAEAIRLATPPWADREAIQRFYDNCPPGHAVDHIIPLLGKNVRGLHTVENFQYLTIEENKRKGNRL